MLESDIKKIDFGGKNTLKLHVVNLDVDLDCIILISSKDHKLTDILYHKIIDCIIDRIHPKNTYRDFSNALENINAFLSTWMQGKDKIGGLHALVGIYSKKTFLFSSIGRASCYLYNSHKDIIEVTDKDDTPKDFSFISSGDIADGEVILLCSMRLIDTLSKDDIRDGLSLGNIERSSENIEHILLHEHSGKNIGLVSITKNTEIEAGASLLDKYSHYFFKACDNRFTKRVLGYMYHIKDRLIHQSQKTKQALFALGLGVSIFFLYIIISGFFSLASNTQDIEQAKIDFNNAQGYIALASENMNDIDAFSTNITLAEGLLNKLESQNIFLNDLETLKSNMSMLKKQFNGIESFETSSENTMYEFGSVKDIVRIVSLANKVYVVHPASISGPIIQGEIPENYQFSELSKGDTFIDAAIYNGNIVLMTEQGKVVNFAKNNYFSYLDVSDQPTWEKSPTINTYGTNLYLLSDSGNQILKHKKQGTGFAAGAGYLKDDDALSIGNILSIAIDGGIYILKSDGSVVKVFGSPEYRLEGITLNKLPANYIFNGTYSKTPSLRTRANLKYVYMYYENKILVFEPNTSRYQDVKSLSYVGQIEGRDIVIEDFYVDNDGEVFLASKGGVYRLTFEVIDDDLVVK